MAAAVPTRPVSGAPVATAWGQDVHDRVYKPAQAHASGPNVAVAANARIPINAISAGGCATLGTNSLILKAGMSGLYLIIVNGYSGSPTADARVELRRAGVVMAGVQPGWITGVANRWSFSLPYVLSDADELYIQAVVACNQCIARFSLIRIGDGYGAIFMDDEELLAKQAEELAATT